MRFLALLLMAALLISGCTQSPSQPGPAQAPGNASPQAAAPEPANQSVADSGQWSHYSNLGISFDYPQDMNVTEQLGGAPGYAIVTLQGRNVTTGAIVVGIVNTSLFSSVAPDPLDEAVSILEFYSGSEDDIVGQAQARGEISKYVSLNGIPLAERSFVLTKAGSSGNNVTMYGYALEFYDAGIKSSYAVRIFSADAAWTGEMRSRFVSSFRTRQ
jgi:hypothetical protein